MRFRRERRAQLPPKHSKCVVIYNPQAGKLRSRGRDRLERAGRILSKAGYETCLVPTTGLGSAVGLARSSVADGVDLIVAAGGDGTINEVAEGMVHSRVPLGILPAGTANVLAMETGMSSKLETAARDLLTYTPRSGFRSAVSISMTPTMASATSF